MLWTDTTSQLKKDLESNLSFTIYTLQKSQLELQLGYLVNMYTNNKFYLNLPLKPFRSFFSSVILNGVFNNCRTPGLLQRLLELL